MPKAKMSTSVAWKTMIMNWVATCENRISMPVIPDTKYRSSMPSLRSISMAPDVNATDKKKMMLRGEREGEERVIRQIVRLIDLLIGRLMERDGDG